MKAATLGEIVARLGGELIGDSARIIERLGAFDDATPSTLCFLAHSRYLSQLKTSHAGAVIVRPVDQSAAQAHGAALIVSADPHLYFARLTQWWVERTRPAAPIGVHASAVVDASARIAPSASIGPLAVIEAGVVIGDGAVVGANCTIGAGASIGERTRLAPQVVIGERCVIGARCLLHGGAVIGADGFGFAPDGGRWAKVEQLGAVRIGNDVEIGANTCVDRGALSDTLIEDGVKLDNQIQIGHNVQIGAHTAMAACVGIAGSTRIGSHCTIGGAALFAGHIVVTDHVHIAGGTVVTRSISKAGGYGGLFPFDDNGVWEKNTATVRQLHAMRVRLRALEDEVRRLAAKTDRTTDHGAGNGSDAHRRDSKTDASP